jgi:AcrR family transcriptional regulator
MEIVSSLFAIVNTLRYGTGVEEKLNRQNWLGAGLEILAEQGLQGLRIMPIAQQLGVTKGSFYWHFNNLEDYQLALLQEWEQRHTQQIIQYVEGQGGDALTKLRNLMTVTVNADARLAKAIRSWADTNPLAHAAQSRVDLDRLVYLQSLLTKLGWADNKAKAFARWMYCALIGHFSLQGPPILAEQLELILETLNPKPAIKRKAR